VTQGAASDTSESSRPAGADPAFLADPRLRELIASILRRKVPSSHLDDAVQDVLEALILWCRSTGVEDEKAISAGATAIIKNITKKWWRNELRRGKSNAGPTDTADDHAREARPDAADPIDVTRALMQLHLVGGPANDRVFALIVLLAEEATAEEMAKQLGGSDVAARKSGQRIREKIATQLRRRGLHDIGLPKLLAAAGMLMLLFLVLPRGNRLVIQDTVAHWVRPPKPFDYTRKDWSAPRVPGADEQEMAKLSEDQQAGYRELIKAEAALKNEDWGACASHAAAAVRNDQAGPGLVQACQDGAARSMDAKGPGARKPKK